MSLRLKPIFFLYEQTSRWLGICMALSEIAWKQLVITTNCYPIIHLFIPIYLHVMSLCESMIWIVDRKDLVHCEKDLNIFSRMPWLLQIKIKLNIIHFNQLKVIHCILTGWRIGSVSYANCWGGSGLLWLSWSHDILNNLSNKCNKA